MRSRHVVAISFNAAHKFANPPFVSPVGCPIQFLAARTYVVLPLLYVPSEGAAGYWRCACALPLLPRHLPRPLLLLHPSFASPPVLHQGRINEALKPLAPPISLSNMYQTEVPPSMFFD
jgi:hypothetical protein